MNSLPLIWGNAGATSITNATLFDDGREQI